MPVLLPNVLISTARATFNAGTGVTSAETAKLSGVAVHIEEDKEANFITQQTPGGALMSNYYAFAASGTDIATGDTITALTLLDGATPWPADWSSGDVWRVTFHRERPGMLLPERYVRIVRTHGSGPAH